MDQMDKVRAMRVRHAQNHLAVLASLDDDMQRAIYLDGLASGAAAAGAVHMADTVAGILQPAQVSIQTG